MLPTKVVGATFGSEAAAIQKLCYAFYGKMKKTQMEKYFGKDAISLYKKIKKGCSIIFG